LPPRTAIPAPSSSSRAIPAHSPSDSARSLAATRASNAPSTLYRVFYPARSKAGRDDLRFHDLRHTGAVLAASTGATLAELMARLAHSTSGAALRYQHAAQDRDRVIAVALSELVAGQVTPINGINRRKGDVET
jgi:integrase